MSFTRSASALVSTLVHPSAMGGPPVRKQNEAFVAQKLAFAFAVLAFAPFYLAYHGAPGITDALLFCFGLLPLCAAMIVAQTGRIVVGHAVAYASFAGIGLTLFLGETMGAACALTWLAVAHLEVLMALDPRHGRHGPHATVAIACVLVLAASLSDAAVVSRFAAPVAALAIIYVLVSARIVIGLFRLTRHHEAEQGARWHAVADAIGDLVLGFDAKGAVASVSSRCAAVLGVAAAALRGRFERVHVADRPIFLKLIADASLGEATAVAKLRLRTGRVDHNPAGFEEPRHLHVEARVRRLSHRGAASENAEVVAILRDVSAIQRQEREIEDARCSIEKAIRSKDHFLANMSHELRTPLNAIIGFSEILGSRTMRPTQADRQREYAGIILQSGQHLLSVVNSILDMSKIQSGTFSIIPEPFDLLQLIEQCCDMIRLKAMQVSITLVQDCPAILDELVGDRRACKQVLLNLLSNAVKFTPEAGTITIKVRPEGTALAITVGDTGIGIREEDLACLGDSFFQARSSLSRPYEGTGLGLCVVRGLVGLHGGSITIDSELNKGTSVTVRLPLDCRASAGKATPAKIETIARNPALDTNSRPQSIRMKTSA